MHTENDEKITALLNLVASLEKETKIKDQIIEEQKLMIEVLEEHNTGLKNMIDGILGLH